MKKKKKKNENLERMQDGPGTEQNRLWLRIDFMATHTHSYQSVNSQQNTLNELDFTKV